MANLIQQMCHLSKGLRLLNLSKTSLTSKGLCKSNQKTKKNYRILSLNPPAPFSHSCLFNHPGVVSLSMALNSSDEYSNSLLHLDLSKNPGVLSGDDASVRKRITFLECSHFSLKPGSHLFSFCVCRACISSCRSPTAWCIWICRAQIALWTQ